MCTPPCLREHLCSVKPIFTILTIFTIFLWYERFSATPEFMNASPIYNEQLVPTCMNMDTYFLSLSGASPLVNERLIVTCGDRHVAQAEER